MDGGAEASPQVRRLLLCGVADGRAGRCEGEDADEVWFGVWLEVEGWRGGSSEVMRGRSGEDEDCCEAWNLDTGIDVSLLLV